VCGRASRIRTFSSHNNRKTRRLRVCLVGRSCRIKQLPSIYRSLPRESRLVALSSVYPARRPRAILRQPQPVICTSLRWHGSYPEPPFSGFIIQDHWALARTTSSCSISLLTTADVELICMLARESKTQTATDLRDHAPWAPQNRSGPPHRAYLHGRQWTLALSNTASLYDLIPSYFKPYHQLWTLCTRCTQTSLANVQNLPFRWDLPSLEVTYPSIESLLLGLWPYDNKFVLICLFSKKLSSLWEHYY